MQLHTVVCTHITMSVLTKLSSGQTPLCEVGMGLEQCGGEVGTICGWSWVIIVTRLYEVKQMKAQTLGSDRTMFSLPFLCHLLTDQL